jgi:4-amino-4-deoxy-L-arabinose transferase-like glycosyltransferase
MTMRTPDSGVEGQAEPVDPGACAAGLGVVAVVSVGALLRGFNFWVPELWIDEYATRWAVADVTWGEAARRAIHSHGQSPFYYMIVKLSCALLGVSPFSLRLPSVLFGIGALALVYPLAIRIFRQRAAALCAMAIFAVNGTMIWYSQEARPYGLALFGILLSFLSYVALLESDRPAWRVAYVLSTAGVFYAHYVFSFVVVVQILHLCLVRGASWLRSRAWPLTFLVLLALCAPGALQLRSLFERRAALNWLPPAGWFSLWQLALSLLNLPALVLVTLAVVLAGFSARQFSSLLDRSRACLLLGWLVVPVVVFGVVPPLFGVSVFFLRYLVFTLPAAVLLTAWLMALAKPDTWRRWIPLATFLLMSVTWYLVPWLVRTGTFVPRGGEGWTKAVPALERAAERDDVILYGSGFVEADQLRLPNPDPLMVSFIQSPVTANLSPGRTLALTGLPFRINAQTRPYVSAVLSRAAGAKRVWIIGIGEPTLWAAVVLVREASFRIVSQQAYGSVGLVLLEPQHP